MKRERVQVNSSRPILGKKKNPCSGSRTEPGRIFFFLLSPFIRFSPWKEREREREREKEERFRST